MRINWSEQSRNDLRDIMLYIRTNFGNRKAKDVIVGINNRVVLLKDFPMLGNVFVTDTELDISYRILTYKLNKIVYFIDGETIIIVTVWQNRRDMKQLRTILSGNIK